MSTSTKKAKNQNGIIAKLIAAVLAILVIALCVFNLVNGKGILLRSKTAAKSDNFKVSGTEMAYFAGNVYQQFYSQYGEYLSAIGLDPNVSLKDQKCPSLEDGTWADYFIEQAETNVKQTMALAEYANANGIELGDEEKEDVENYVASMTETAASYNRPLDNFLKAYFGNGINEKDLRNALKLSLLADKASAAFVEGVDVSKDAMEKYYAENPDEFDGVDFYAYTLDISAASEGADENAEEGEETVAVTSAAALNFIAGMADVTDLNGFKTIVADYETTLNPEADAEAIVDGTLREHVLKSGVTDEELSAWLFDEAKVGDVKTVVDSENGLYSIFVLDKAAYRDDTMNRDVRHILIAADEENPDDDSAAQAVLDELKAADFSDEKWNELAEEKSIDTGSKDNGGLYEDFVHGQAYEEFDNWLFDADRKAGDSDVIKTTAGWHVIYYVGESDTAAWEPVAQSAITNNEYSAMIEEMGKSVEFIDSTLAKIELN